MTQTATTTKRITKATFKSFIKKNAADLMIKCESSFSGMTDMVEYEKGARFEPVRKEEGNLKNTFGILGAWLVGNSRDYFTAYEADGFKGISVYNCCGSFVVAVKA